MELPEFTRRAKRILTNEEIDALLYHLSANPDAGNLIEGTGGIRKLRRASKGKGKSGGSRTIYFFYNETILLFLLTISSKSEKENPSKSERNELGRLTGKLVSNYKR